MQASSSRFAPMSSARTPTRAGFSELMVDNTQRAKVVVDDHTHWLAQGSLAHILFAAPMVGASPDNIGAQRLAEGGVPASGAGSAQGEPGHQTGEPSK